MKRILFLMGLVFMVGLSKAAYFDENYNGYSVGYKTVAGDIGADAIRTSGQYEIVDAASGHSDPFGGSGNHSLWMGDTYAGSAGAWYRGYNPITGKGYAIFKLYRVSDYLYVRLLGKNSSGTEVEAITLYARDYGDPNSLFTENGGSAFDQKFPANTVHTLRIDFDTNTDTWTGMLNGVPITQSSGAVTSFNFAAGCDNIVGAYLGCYSGTQPSCYFDEVKISPIPKIGYLDEDFDGLLAGTATDPLSLGADRWRYPGHDGTYAIVGSASNPADPFGGAGNHSLVLKCDTGEYAGVWYEDYAPITNTGVKVSLKLYKAEGSYLQVFVQGNNPSTVDTIKLVVNPDNSFRIDSGVIFDQAIQPETVYILEIITDNLDNSTDTWTGKLNGVPLTTDSGATSIFDFNNDCSNIDGIYLASAPGSLSALAFIDDVKVEPYYLCGDSLHPYPEGDLSQDCRVDMADVAILAENWLDCSYNCD